MLRRRGQVLFSFIAAGAAVTATAAAALFPLCTAHGENQPEREGKQNDHSQKLHTRTLKRQGAG